MKLEKRDAGIEEPTPAQTPKPPNNFESQEEPSSAKKTTAQRRNKPVLVYIMVLFIVAFLMMALSLFMHQRSNEEVIGSLQNSVTTLQELQASEEANINLQIELEAATAQIKDLEAQVKKAAAAEAEANNSAAALLSLYTLQQQYTGRDYDACKHTIQTMESSGQSALLSETDPAGAISPAQRYQQLKEAVMSH